MGLLRSIVTRVIHSPFGKGTVSMTRSGVREGRRWSHRQHVPVAGPLAPPPYNHRLRTRPLCCSRPLGSVYPQSTPPDPFQVTTCPHHTPHLVSPHALKASWPYVHAHCYNSLGLAPLLCPSTPAVQFTATITIYP